MIIQVTYEILKKEYPDAVSVVIKKLRNGNSKSKNVDESELTWKLVCAQQCQEDKGMLDIINGLGTSSIPEKDPETFEEYWSGLKLFVHVQGSIGRWHGNSNMLHTIPSIIKERYRENWENDQNEKNRIAKMSSEERRNETYDLLKQLKKESPGFFVVMNR